MYKPSKALKTDRFSPRSSVCFVYMAEEGLMSRGKMSQGSIPGAWFFQSGWRGGLFKAIKQPNQKHSEVRGLRFTITSFECWPPCSGTWVCGGIVQCSVHCSAWSLVPLAVTCASHTFRRSSLVMWYRASCRFWIVSCLYSLTWDTGNMQVTEV